MRKISFKKSLIFLSCAVLLIFGTQPSNLFGQEIFDLQVPKTDFPRIELVKRLEGEPGDYFSAFLVKSDDLSPGEGFGTVLGMGYYREEIKGCEQGGFCFQFITWLPSISHLVSKGGNVVIVPEMTFQPVKDAERFNTCVNYLLEHEDIRVPDAVLASGSLSTRNAIKYLGGDYPSNIHVRGWLSFGPRIRGDLDEESIANIGVDVLMEVGSGDRKSLYDGAVIFDLLELNGRAVEEFLIFEGGHRLINESTPASEDARKHAYEGIEYFLGLTNQPEWWDGHRPELQPDFNVIGSSSTIREVE